MGVFGEKHTSLTREQKRQLIHQADTHKLRPTEVCDWVQATWGLRIARVTVYSILHKQRASLMAGHKDLYQTMQNSINSLSGTKDATTADPCLDRNKETGRVNKYRASPNKNKNKSKDNDSANGMDNATKLSKKNTNDNNNKRSRSTSVMSDRSYSSTTSGPYGDGNGEVGARWEGQLKRVREPASVELDRAMVQFLKSPASVDSQGRRLNDAELQSHALRLAQSIPSAKRMRCSFGWLRHFKRRLGVQWAADKLGRHRWIVEMDHDQEQSSTTTTEGEIQQVKIKQESDHERFVSSTLSETQSDGDVDRDGIADDIDEKYYSLPRKRSKTRPSLDSILGHDNSPQSVSQAQSSQQQHSSQSILVSYPNLFGSLPPLHISGTNGSMDTISPLATTLDPKLTSTTLPSATTAAPSAFGMSVDGKMRKVPTKEEAYEMLQSLLMYYEQDHFYIGEQQTLLLPRWIHQQRQILQQTRETDARMMWIQQQQQQQQQTPINLYSSFGPHGMSTTEPLHPYHRYHSSFSSASSSSTASLSPPALSPISTLSPLSPLTPDSPLISPFNLGFTGAMGMGPAAGLSGHLVSGKSDPLFSTSSPMTSFDHQQILGGHPFSLASFQH